MIRPITLSVVTALVTSSWLWCAAEAQPTLGTPANFQRSQLVAWCIVPFDAAKRGPEQRAQMVAQLGLRRVAYDWRQEHVASFEAEFEAYQRHGLELFAFWGEHDLAFELFEKHGLHPQIWKTCPSPPGGKGLSQQQRVSLAVEQLRPLAQRCKTAGCALGLYNHGGWGGQPENLVAVCEALRSEGFAQVGIVYNFHHAHDRIGDFAEALARMQPYLLCLNLNGMNDRPEPKILPIGSGEHEAAMIEAVIASGYEGPIGILDHIATQDARLSLENNLAGLERLLGE